jgi:succinoglycan biosynthesis transport protein ExoP
MQQPQTNPKADAPSFETNANLRHYVHVVLERRWLAISAFLVVLVLTGLYLAKAPRYYMATARLQINRESDNPLNVREVTVDSRFEMDYLQTQYKNLQSRTLLEEVVDALELDKKDPRYSKAADKNQAITMLMNDVSIVPVRMSRLVDVRVEHTDRNQAKLIANAIVQTFRDDNLKQRATASLDALTWLQTQETDTGSKVKEAEDALQTYRIEHNEISLEDSENLVRQGLFAAKNELSRSHLETLQAEQNMAEIENLLASGKSLDTIPQIRDNPTLQKLREDQAVKESALASWLTRYREKHPVIIQARAELVKLQEQMKEEAEATLQAIRNNVEILKKKEEGLVANVEQETQKQQALGALRIEYDALKRDSDTRKAIYGNVLTRRSETELMSRLQANNMRIVDPAVLPLAPVKPRVALTLLFGVFGGMMAGVGLAFFVNYLDDSIKSQDDVETALGLPFLGYVPNIKTNSVVERDLQAHSHPQSNAAEGFRTIRATLSLTHKADKLRLVSVTSTIPSEGKSLVASNVAIVSAQTGLRTLLVDADLRRPSVHKAYQLHSPVGLSAFLKGETSDLDEITHKTEVPNLDVICCGAVPNNPSELIGSARMTEFLEKVRGKYDRVVLDCPPISAVSDPLVISAKSDGIIFVTKFNKIRREHAIRSVQRIQNAGIHIMGVVINDIDFEGKDSYYYSYYYYQNRYYSSHYKTKPDDAPSAKPAKVAKHTADIES